MTGTLIESFSFYGDFGITYVLKFVKDSGELLMYMGSAYQEVDLGKSYTFKATVKGHEEYKNEKQTKVARIANLQPSQ